MAMSGQPSLLKSARTTPIPLASGFPTPGCIAHIGKSSVVIVVIELDVLALVVAGMAIGAIARPALATPNVVLRTPVDVVGHDQIEPAIFVVIEPSGARGPSAFVGDSSLRGDVGERSVSVVVIKNGAAIAGDVQIRIAVIVEVTDRHSLTVVTFAADAGFLGDIGESSVAVVVVERAAQRMRRFVNIGGSRLDEIQIHQAILVVVDPGHACPHGFEIIFFVGLRGVLLESDLGLLADVGVTNRDCRLGLRRRLRCKDGGTCCAEADHRDYR